MSKNEENVFMEKVKHLLSQISIQTYLYGLLAIGAIVLIVSNARLGNKGYLVSKNSDTECRYPRGTIVKIDPSKGEGCIDIYGAAKDYGIDLSYIDSNSPTANTGSDNNLTLDMSKDLILTNIYLDQNGITDPTQKGKILAGVVSGYSSQISGKVYTKGDLNLSREENKNAYAAYYNDIANAIIKYNSDIKNYNTTHNSNSNLSTSNDNALLDQIKTNMSDLIKINNDFSRTLLSIPATNSGSQYQLKLINLISDENTYLESLGNVSGDPMKYLTLGGDTYLKSFYTDFQNYTNDFIKYFKGLGIIKK